MKKVLIGCAVVFILVVVLVVGLGIWIVGKARTVVAATEQIHKDYQAVNDGNAFSEPESDVPTDAQFQRWLAVREPLQTQAKALADSLESSKNSPFKALSKAFEGGGQIMRAHATALRENNMSTAEYDWITRRAFTALVSGDAAADTEFAPLATALVEAQKAMQGQGSNGTSVDFSQNNDLTVMLRSEEIGATLAALKPHLVKIKATMDVFKADLIILPMLEGFNLQVRDSDLSSTQALDAALDNALNPQAPPAAAPAQ